MKLGTSSPTHAFGFWDSASERRDWPERGGVLMNHAQAEEIVSLLREMLFILRELRDMVNEASGV